MDSNIETAERSQRASPARNQFGIKTYLFVTLYVCVLLAVFRTDPGFWKSILIVTITAAMVGTMFPLSYKALFYVMVLLCLLQVAFLSAVLFVHQVSIGGYILSICILMWTQIMYFFIDIYISYWSENKTAFRIFTSSFFTAIASVSTLFLYLSIEAHKEVGEDFDGYLYVCICLINILMIPGYLFGIFFASITIRYCDALLIKNRKSQKVPVEYYIQRVVPACSLALMITVLLLFELPKFLS